MDDYIYERIICKLNNLVIDINSMIEKKNITKEAAEWLKKRILELLNLYKFDDEFQEKESIINKISCLTDDVNYMIEKEDITKEAANWFNKVLQEVLTLYEDNFYLFKEENKSRTHY